MASQINFASCSNSEKIARALRYLNLDEPALSIYLGLVEFQPVDTKNFTLRLSTRRTGAEAFIEYNPKFIEAIQEESVLAFLLYVEGLRLALHHCTIRLQTPAELHKKSSDIICCDIKKTLDSNRQSVKEIIGTFPNISQIEPYIKPLGYKHSEDFCLEKLIAYLRKLQSEDKQNGQGKEQQKSEGQDQSEGAGETNENGDCDCSSFENQSDAIKKHFNSNNREMTAEWGENTSVDESIRQATEVLKNTPEMWGTLTGGLQSLIAVANVPRFDPSAVLRRFKAIIQSQNTYQTRSKINKKHEDLCGWRHENETRIVECIDTSGSMSDESIAMGEAFINLFIKHADTSYCFWDCSCTDPIHRGKKKLHVGERLEVEGRGGTDPQCIIEKLETLRGSKNKFGGVIVFTDCGFDWPDPGPKWRNKILIISTTSREAAPEWATERGRVIALKDIIEWNERNA